VDHEIEFALVLNLGVVNLDLVGLRKRHRGGGKQSESDPSQHEVDVSLKEIHCTQGLP
jgi:hypothetical protein